MYCSMPQLSGYEGIYCSRCKLHLDQCLYIEILQCENDIGTFLAIFSHYNFLMKCTTCINNVILCWDLQKFVLRLEQLCRNSENYAGFCLNCCILLWCHVKVNVLSLASYACKVLPSVRLGVHTFWRSLVQYSLRTWDACQNKLGSQ